MKTQPYKELKINNMVFEYGTKDNAIRWSDSWESIYELTRLGIAKAKDGGPGTFGHTDFIVINEQLADSIRPFTYKNNKKIYS